MENIRYSLSISINSMDDVEKLISLFSESYYEKKIDYYEYDIHFGHELNNEIKLDIKWSIYVEDVKEYNKEIVKLIEKYNKIIKDKEKRFVIFNSNKFNIHIIDLLTKPPFNEYIINLSD
ncbi:MAG: hypothetical protein IJ094_13020 [Bacilli bacterium]|nr:hypothetical protein [Bacilli bacterium]